MKGRIPGRSLLLAAAVAWMVSGVVAAKEPDAVRKYESEGRSSFDYGIGIRTDIVRNKRLSIEENEPMETHVVILGTSDIHGNICCWSYEENRETAFLDLHRLIGDNKEASDALFAFQYEATRAAFYGGFAAAMELVTGIRPLI